MENKENQNITEKNEDQNKNIIQPQNLSSNSQNQNIPNQQPPKNIIFTKPNERIKTKVINIKSNFNFLIIYIF